MPQAYAKSRAVGIQEYFRTSGPENLTVSSVIKCKNASEDCSRCISSTDTMDLWRTDIHNTLLYFVAVPYPSFFIIPLSFLSCLIDWRGFWHCSCRQLLSGFLVSLVCVFERLLRRASSYHTAYLRLNYTSVRLFTSRRSVLLLCNLSFHIYVYRIKYTFKKHFRSAPLFLQKKFIFQVKF